jgi:acyl-coenzyme A thioesterase PaaI-like protein
MGHENILSVVFFLLYFQIALKIDFVFRNAKSNAEASVLRTGGRTELKRVRLVPFDENNYICTFVKINRNNKYN